MTPLNDDLHFVCAWGCWRIDQALNEPVLACSVDRRLAHRRPVRKQPKLARRRRLHLVGGTATTRAPGAPR